MKKLTSVWVMVLGVCTMLGAATGFAAEVAVDAKAAEEKAFMEKMQKLTSPSEAHKALEPLAGKWTYTSKFWMTAESKAEESTGTAENTLMFGGRFLKQDIKGAWMNQPFEGLGYTGYDNIRGEYVSTWMDSMATGIGVSAGQFDTATKTFSQSGANSCPLTGEKARKTRSEWKLTDNDHASYTVYLGTPDGKEFKGMEIAYIRAA